MLSTAASGRQLIDLARRRLLPTDRGQVLVVDPTGELPGAAREADALVRAFYPAATVLAGATASPAHVLAVFSAAAPEVGLLELCCHAHVGGTADTGHLKLTGQLTIADVLRRAAGREPWAEGPTVVFGACDTDVTWADFDESLTLATTCLAAGATAVVGARWAVLDHLTAVAMFALHHFLTARRERPPTPCARPSCGCSTRGANRYRECRTTLPGTHAAPRSPTSRCGRPSRTTDADLPTPLPAVCRTFDPCNARGQSDDVSLIVNAVVAGATALAEGTADGRDGSGDPLDHWGRGPAQRSVAAHLGLSSDLRRYSIVVEHVISRSARDHEPCG